MGAWGGIVRINLLSRKKTSPQNTSVKTAPAAPLTYHFAIMLSHSILLLLYLQYGSVECRFARLSSCACGMRLALRPRHCGVLKASTDQHPASCGRSRGGTHQPIRGIAGAPRRRKLAAGGVALLPLLDHPRCSKRRQLVPPGG